MKLTNQSYEILTPIDRNDILKRLELFARVCHKSETRVTDSIDDSANFVSKLVSMGHLGILEHYTFSVRLITDRGVTHELVRHRIASYLQQSTRYCDSSEIEVIVPVSFRDKIDTMNPAWLAWYNAMYSCEEAYKSLIETGCSKDIARSVLPISLKTEIIVTANLREWLNIFNLRISKHAHEQIVDLLTPLKNKLHEIVPEIF
jgi:thymidylate synthase (FAD)